MGLTSSWRGRLPDLAALLDDPRVHAVLLEPSGAVDVRDAAGERLDLVLPPLPQVVLAALLRRPGGLEDEAFAFVAVPGPQGVALSVRRRPSEDQLGLPAELDHPVSRALALGASALVVAPTAAMRALGVAALARAASRQRRVAALPSAGELGAWPVTLDAVARLGAIDRVTLVAGELEEATPRVLASAVPCVASVAGLDLEAGVARLAGVLASARPGMAHASIAGWIARRFDVLLELDPHRITALAELHPAADGALTTVRVVRRGLDGALEVDLLGSRIEHLLGGDVPRPKVSAPAHAATAVARPPRSEPAVSRHGPVIVRAGAARSQPPRRAEGSSVSPTSEARPSGRLEPVRESLRVEPLRPEPLRGSIDPAALEPSRSPGGGVTIDLSPPSSRLAPIVEPPPGTHARGLLSPARVESQVLAADLASSASPHVGRVGLDELSELTADQLVSQSFIVDVGEGDGGEYDPELADDDVSAEGALAFDDAPADRAPMDRLSTEVPGRGASSLAQPLPQIIGFGASDETMQIHAGMLRASSSPGVELIDEATIEPSNMDEDDRATRTAMGLLAEADDPAPSRPPTGRAPGTRVRRAKP